MRRATTDPGAPRSPRGGAQLSRAAFSVQLFSGPQGGRTLLVMAAVKGADINQLNIMQSFSQSTQSLPSVSSKVRDLGVPTIANLKRFQSIAEFTNEKRKIVHKLSKTDMDSIENVCKFINNNSEPNLTELPGLKIKQNLPAPSKPHFQSALQLKIFIHEDKVLKTSLKSKEMTIQSLSSSIFSKLDISTEDRKDFQAIKA